MKRRPQAVLILLSMVVGVGIVVLGEPTRRQVEDRPGICLPHETVVESECDGGCWTLIAMDQLLEAAQHTNKTADELVEAFDRWDARGRPPLAK